MRALVGAVLVVALTTAACGGDSESDAETSGPEQVEASSATPTPTPEYVESETCRTAMRPIVDVMLANDGSVSFNDFTNRFDQLDDGIDAAIASCSPAVNDPAREAMYEFAKANATWRGCESGDQKCTDKITEAVTAGVRLAGDVDEALSATS